MTAPVIAPVSPSPGQAPGAWKAGDGRRLPMAAAPEVRRSRMVWCTGQAGSTSRAGSLTGHDRCAGLAAGRPADLHRRRGRGRRPPRPCRDGDHASRRTW